MSLITQWIPVYFYLALLFALLFSSCIYCIFVLNDKVHSREERNYSCECTIYTRPKKSFIRTIHYNKITVYCRLFLGIARLVSDPPGVQMMFDLRQGRPRLLMIKDS